MDDKKKMVIGISVICIIMFFIALGKDEPERETEEFIKATNTPKPTATLKPTPTESPSYFEKHSHLSESTYKMRCKELYYDDVFFSKTNLKGELVKLDLYLTSKQYFTVDSLYNSFLTDMIDKYKIMFYSFLACVRRGNSDVESYVGEDIRVFFTEEFDLKPDDYKAGQKIILYGEVISYSTNTWSGYNDCIVVPKYIEIKE